MANFDFSQLPEDLIHLAMKHLTDIEDVVQFGAACRSWQSVVALSPRGQQPCFNPCLMLTNDDADPQNLRYFFSLSTKREFAIKLPAIHGRRCWGSPYGWMVTFGLDLNMHLLNPFSGVQLSLPHPSTFPNEWIKKMEPELVRQRCPVRFCLSSNPSLTNQSCMVIAIHAPQGKLSFAKPGDGAWTPIDTPIPFLLDAIFFNHQVYAVNCAGTLIVCDIHIPTPKGTLFGSLPLPDSVRSGEHYLFEMSGELHVAVRYSKAWVTNKFEVYKFDFKTKSWSEVCSLGRNALFLGFNTTFVIPISEYPGFKGNAIFYTDDKHRLVYNSSCEMLVFDFEKKTFEPIYLGANMLSKYSQPIFIVPSL